MILLGSTETGVKYQGQCKLQQWAKDMKLVHSWLLEWVMPEREWSSCHRRHMNKPKPRTYSLKLFSVSRALNVLYCGISSKFPGACLPGCASLSESSCQHLMPAPSLLVFWKLLWLDPGHLYCP